MLTLWYTLIIWRLFSFHFQHFIFVEISNTCALRLVLLARQVSRVSWLSWAFGIVVILYTDCNIFPSMINMCKKREVYLKTFQITIISISWVIEINTCPSLWTFIVSHITILSIYIMGQRNTCPSLWTFMVFLTRPRGVCSLVESTFCDVSRGVRITLLMITMNIHMIVMVSSSNNWRRQCSLTKDCPRHQVTVGGGLPPASQVNVRDSPEVRNVGDKPS